MRRVTVGCAVVVAAGWFAVAPVRAQQGTPAPQVGTAAQTPAAAGDDQENGPAASTDGIILEKKKEQPVPPPAPAEENKANAAGQIFSMRVDVPVVSLDVNVILDQTHQFVPGLKPDNFLVVEDGVEQNVTSLRVTKTPITAVLLLEFASTSYPFVQDMVNAAAAFYRTIQPNDYVAIETYDMRPHILTDFTNNKDLLREALESLQMPLMRETNEFDALYETLDRLSRVDGQKYIILIGSGVDTMSKLDLDQMMAKIRATPGVTIFTISTGAFAREMGEDMGRMGGMRESRYLQADNEMRTFAAMTGGMSFAPVFQGELPDIFTQINESIRNQYVLTYTPTDRKDDGTYRKVKVYLVDNEGRPLKMQDENGKSLKYSVIARDGYWAKLPVQ